ncbi:hypothetical protein ACWIUD_05200 [Helicobacter sp. 23-1044]
MNLKYCVIARFCEAKSWQSKILRFAESSADSAIFVRDSVIQAQFAES